MTLLAGRKIAYLLSIAILIILLAPAATADTEETDDEPFDLTKPFSVNIAQRITIGDAEYRGEYRAIFHHENRAFRLEGIISAPDADDPYDILVTSDGETVGVRVATPDKTISQRFESEEFDRHTDDFSIYNGLSPKTYRTALQRSRYRRDITAEHEVDDGIKVFRISATLSRRQPAISRLNIHISERQELPLKVTGMDGNDRNIMTLVYSDYQRATIDDMEIFTVHPETPRPESPTVEEQPVETPG